MSSKHTDEGITERSAVLSNYIPDMSFARIKEIAAEMKCNMDDITDAVCLAVVANMEVVDKTETIPEQPMKDETGLFMQMVVPKKMENV